MIRAVLVALLLASLGIGSYVVLPIEDVEVAGNRQLSDTFVQQITGLEPGRPWLWAWPHKLEALRQNPWVKSATLERPALGRLRIVLEERTSLASLIQGGERYGLSRDGLLLPGAPARDPVLEGRGEIPIADLLLLVQTFPDATRIRYSVAGFQVLAPNLNVWGKNVRELQDWAKVRRIGKSDASNSLAHPGVSSDSRIYVYSWGVSARR
ncbi:FtsQ-type POTRA domain-containing protein [uncultured Meiothermus sp.]|jgi:cell division protein FtsQ|uniref:cell division protein FtsQ/DivIB n=1 Tax=uncultured Meiothermus sp. TaxID=157471 RepID=UPI00262E5F8B|nr:FtsQ-type POTRA domain-containing protein [uncultured Meiothermus sp.]